MAFYIALVEHEAGSAFGVSFPDLPGVFSAADARGDVMPNAIEALRLWAEDEPLPEPADHDQIMVRDDVLAALAAGAYLIEVPLIDVATDVVRANVSFERGMLRAIDAEADRRKQTRASFLADAARHEIERGWYEVSFKPKTSMVERLKPAAKKTVAFNKLKSGEHRVAASAKPAAKKTAPGKSKSGAEYHVSASAKSAVKAPTRSQGRLERNPKSRG